MNNTDLSSSKKPHIHSRVSLRKTLRCGFAVVLCSCLFYGAQQCRAQESQPQNQDVADAARKERARREQEITPPHIYTDEDLRRAKILTPEDEARLAAVRKSQPPAEQTPEDSLDANGLPQLPLGDVARLYRSAKQATESAFHLPVDEPALASPVFPVDSLVAPRPAIALTPAAPKIAPAHPKLIVPPSMSSDAPVRRVDPFTRRLRPTAPQPPVATTKPSLPSIAAPANAVDPAIPSVSHVNPSPDLHAISPKPAESSSSAAIAAPRVVTVQRGDSLWKIAEQTLGRGSRWRDLLAANPTLANPNVLEVGTQLNVPADIREPRATKVKVNPGDTLTKIAQAQYGRASYWRCIAEANSAVSNANRIYQGQELTLPSRCKP